LEIEVDNWVVQTEAFVDDVEINGVVYDFETSASTSMKTVVREPIISIMGSQSLSLVSDEHTE